MQDLDEPTRQLTAASNPFGAKQNQLATVQVEQERAVAEVQAAMLLARRFPRDPVQAMDRILNACTRPGLAEGALYSYSKGGSEISGPSIRMAETLAQEWGNIRSGVIELSRGSKDGKSFSEAKAYSWNLETNTYEEKIFQVPHWRDTKAGGYAIRDEREIYELVANVGARRKRACILAVIPGDVTEGAVKQCEVTLNSTADTTPENMQKMLKAFADNFGVTKEQIEKRIQRRVESIQPAQVISLKKIFASIKDGMSNAEDWFEGGANGDKPSLVKKPEAAKQPEKPTETEPTFTEDSESEALTASELLGKKLDDAGITEEEFMEYARKLKLAKDGQQWSDLAESKFATALKGWDALVKVVRPGGVA